jgi:putative membrane protein
MRIQKRILNPQVLLESFCYLIFAVLMFQLVISGKYQAYVTPRMVPYLYFTSGVMAVWAFLGLFRLFSPQHRIRTAHCFVLAIPIMLFLLPHAPIRTADLSSGYLSGNVLVGLSAKNSFNASPGSSNGNGQNSPGNFSAGNLANDRTNEEKNIGINTELDGNSATKAASPDLSAESDVIIYSDSNDVDDIQFESQPVLSSETQPAPQESGYTVSPPPGLDVKNKKITVRDEDFALWLSELFINMEKYEGYRISVKGFVFRDPETMTSNEFVPARLMMSCCAADLAPFGLICKYDKVSELKEDTWIMVEGVIHIGKYIDQDEPQITVTRISPADKPEQEYVYP